MTKTNIIETLGLFENEREGGYLSPTYESALPVSQGLLPGFAATDEPRTLCSAIYYYLGECDISVLHRVTGDMLYHFYLGDPVELFLLDCRSGDCRSEHFTLGTDLMAGQRPLKEIPGNVWMGSRVASGGKEALMGVTMAPGFHPVDYDIAVRDELLQICPTERKAIIEFTRSLREARQA